MFIIIVVNIDNDESCARVYTVKKPYHETNSRVIFFFESCFSVTGTRQATRIQNENYSRSDFRYLSVLFLHRYGRVKFRITSHTKINFMRSLLQPEHARNDRAPYGYCSRSVWAADRRGHRRKSVDIFFRGQITGNNVDPPVRALRRSVGRTGKVAVRYHDAKRQFFKKISLVARTIREQRTGRRTDGASARGKETVTVIR